MGNARYTGSTIGGNTASYGGGIFVSGFWVRCWPDKVVPVSGNSAAFEGGGIIALLG